MCFVGAWLYLGVLGQCTRACMHRDHPRISSTPAGCIRNAQVHAPMHAKCTPCLGGVYHAVINKCALGLVLYRSGLTRTHTHAHAHTHTHTHTLTNIHTYTRTHTETRTQKRQQQPRTHAYLQTYASTRSPYIRGRVEASIFKIFHQLSYNK